MIVRRLIGARGALVEMNGALSRGLAAIPLAIRATGEVRGRLMTNITFVGVLVLWMGKRVAGRASRGVDLRVGLRGVAAMAGNGVGSVVGSVGCFVW